MASFRVRPSSRTLVNHADNQSQDPSLTQLRHEVWRSITAALVNVPQLKVNVFVLGLFEELIESTSKEVLLRVLMAIDITSVQLQGEVR